MNEVSLTADAPLTRESSVMGRVFRSRILELLQGLRDCSLTIREGSESIEVGREAIRPGQTLKAGFGEEKPELK